MKTKRLLIIIFVILCSSCSSKPSNFYALMPLHGHYKQSDKKYLGLGPISLPGYIKRPQIVTRLTNHQLKINEYERWSEQLTDNIRHVIQQNLQQLVPSSHVFLYPWTLDTRIDYRIDINITRFDADAKGRSVLYAHWKVSDKLSKKIYLIKTSKITLATDPRNYSAIVNSMNQNLTTLTRNIAKSIRNYTMKRKAHKVSRSK